MVFKYIHNNEFLEAFSTALAQGSSIREVRIDTQIEPTDIEDTGEVEFFEVLIEDLTIKTDEGTTSETLVEPPKKQRRGRLAKKQIQEV